MCGLWFSILSLLPFLVSKMLVNVGAEQNVEPSAPPSLSPLSFQQIKEFCRKREKRARKAMMIFGRSLSLIQLGILSCRGVDRKG